MKLTLEKLLSSDKDTEILSEIHNQPSVVQYISISDNYFDYVTKTENVFYYKIKIDGIIIGGIHYETYGKVMYLNICIDEKYRNRGFAETALKQLFSTLPDNVEQIIVSIDETNTASLSLFQKLGFVQTGKEDELLIYSYLKEV